MKGFLYFINEGFLYFINERIFIFCENGGINKSHGITFNNNFIKLFIVGRAKTVLFISMKKNLLLLVCKVDKLLTLDLLNFTDNYLFLTIGIYSIIINRLFLTLYLRIDTTFGII